MSTVEDTGEFRRIIAHEMSRRSNRARPIDIALIAVIASVGAAVMFWTVLATAQREYFIEPGRVMLSLASAATCVASVATAAYLLNRANQRRQEELVGLIARAGRDRIVHEVLNAVDRRSPEARKLSRSEYWEVYQDVMADLGDLPSGTPES